MYPTLSRTDTLLVVNYLRNVIEIVLEIVLPNYRVGTLNSHLEAVEILLIKFGSIN
jgi:hypothetical protein